MAHEIWEYRTCAKNITPLQGFAEKNNTRSRASSITKTAANTFKHNEAYHTKKDSKTISMRFDIYHTEVKNELYNPSMVLRYN